MGPLAVSALGLLSFGAWLTPEGAGPLVLAEGAGGVSVELTPDGSGLVVRSAAGVVQDGELSDGPVHWRQVGGGVFVHGNSDGRIDWVQWSTGRGIRVRRDDAGQVVEVAGPGASVARVGRTAGGLTIEDAVGGVLAVSEEVDESGAGRWQVVRDGAGRQVRTRLEGAEVVAWEDPRGLTTKVLRREDRVELVGPGGGVWRVGHDDPSSESVWLEQPDGLRWSWEIEGGRVLAVVDPTGRRARWDYDERGHLLAAEAAGRTTRIERDDADRPTAIIDATGAMTQLRWRDGRVYEVVDPAGSVVLIERGADGRPTGVVARGGGRFELQHGSDGLLRAVVDPVGRTLKIGRDSSGRVARVEQGDGGVRLRRDGDGRITAVDTLGQDAVHTGLVRDASGRVKRVLRADSTIVVDRDSAGEVQSVRLDRREVVVLRDARGRAVAAGPIEWHRDIVGRVVGVDGPGFSWDLTLDSVGALRRVRAGEGASALAVDVERDAAGRALAWRSGGSVVEVQRDAAGRTVVESVDGRTVRLTRGPRGLPQRLEAGRGTWRWSRGADGAVLRATGPDGAGIGVDRDDAGRVQLTRLPGGAILRRIFDGDLVLEALDDGRGTSLARHAWLPDIWGRPRWTQLDDAPRSMHRYDATGRRVAVELGEDAAWSFSPSMEQGPGGWVRALDELGRTTELMVGEQWPAWGAVGGAWAYVRDEAGRLASVNGADGAFTIVHDALQRMVLVDSPAGTWSVDWDARGRPSSLSRPSGRSELIWPPSPDVDGEWRPLATGADSAIAWVHGPGVWGWSAAEEGGGRAAGGVGLPGLSGAYVEDPMGTMAVARTPSGGWDSGALAPFDATGGVQLFTGGPRLYVGGALEPAGAERTDGTLDWPWVVDDGHPRVMRSVIDPSGWSAEGPWGDPLALAVELGVVDLPATTAGTLGEPALTWLPASLDAPPVPAGPIPGAIDLDGELEPLVSRIVAHVQTGEGPVDWRVLTGPLVDADRELGWLPPGLSVPGLHPPGARQASRARSISQKVVAPWEGVL